jgi:hypothetical protein
MYRSTSITRLIEASPAETAAVTLTKRTFNDDLAATIKAIRMRCSSLQIGGLFQGLAVALAAFYLVGVLAFGIALLFYTFTR